MTAFSLTNKRAVTPIENVASYLEVDVFLLSFFLLQYSIFRLDIMATSFFTKQNVGCRFENFALTLIGSLEK